MDVPILKLIKKNIMSSEGQTLDEIGVFYETEREELELDESYRKKILAVAIDRAKKETTISIIDIIKTPWDHLYIVLPSCLSVVFLFTAIHSNYIVAAFTMTGMLLSQCTGLALSNLLYKKQSKFIKYIFDEWPWPWKRL